MLEFENLLGRPFELGRADCVEVLRDFYRQNYGIEITNYARPKDWDADKLDILGKVYAREGFVKVEDWTLGNLHPGDVLCMAIGSSKANHLAVYLGGNMIVHHVLFQLSNTEMLRDFWRKSICYVVRHPDVPYEEPVIPTTPLEDIIRARYQVKAEEAPEEDGSRGTLRPDPE